MSALTVARIDVDWFFFQYGC